MMQNAMALHCNAYEYTVTAVGITIALHDVHLLSGSGDHRWNHLGATLYQV